MEHMRLLIAIAISFAVFFVWSRFFAPQPQPTTSEDTQVTSQAQSTSPQSETEAAPQADKETLQTTATAPDLPAIPDSTSSQTPQRKIKVETPLFRMIFSDRGAAVKSVVLKNYRETLDTDSPLKELISDQLMEGSVLLNVKGDFNYGLSGAIFNTDLQGDSLEVTDQPVVLKFRHQTQKALVVEKTFTFKPDSYLVDLEVALYNASDRLTAATISLGLGNVMEENTASYGFAGPSALINNKLEQIKLKKIDDKNRLEGKIRWLAIEDRYFMTSLILKDTMDAVMTVGYDNKKVKNQVLIDTGGLKPQELKRYRFNVFAGPKSLSLLKSLNCDLDRAINFGWFDFLAKPCLWFMNFIYGFIPNYGVAIIILTLITRGLFWPLAKKSYKSMGEMRRLQPLMQEIREKYKDDKARMNQEMMALYKTYKINPLGGCLPMLIQLPVFFALYRMLYQAIELRHAPFFGWITDLSAPDRLFHFNFKIPMMEAPYGIPVLTIIMGASMLLQQKMTPSPGDPTQAKMMMLMPIVFTVIFINFSSGLVLYWLISNIFSIAQQYFTQRKKV